ncbi:MAG: hypothetical protein R2911_14405 [Caldilineaceae bacterium]
MINIINLEAEQSRYQDMLKAAEHERLVRRALAGQPSRMAQMRNQLGAMLSNLGQWLHNEAAMPGSGSLHSNA